VSNASERRYFDDLVVGETHQSPGRTVTEADIVAFAGLSGDYNAIHVDARHASNTVFGERIAHGLLVLSIASGLSTRTPFNYAVHDSIVGALGIEVDWPNATRIGDTLDVEIEVASKSLSKSGTKGVVVLTRTVRNQDRVTVMTSRWKVLMSTRPVDSQIT
jgi:acyl dehydratase